MIYMTAFLLRFGINTLRSGCFFAMAFTLLSVTISFCLVRELSLTEILEWRSRSK